MIMNDIPKFVKNKFITKFYMIEYSALIGGETFNCYSSGGERPNFSNNSGKHWRSIRDIKLHLNLSGDYYNQHYIVYHPVVCCYQYYSGNIITKNVVCLLEDLLAK